jgi:GNAT superfamily N-acetyltransferase
MSAPAVLRQARRDDITALWRVRYAVTENTLAPGRLSDEDVRREIEDTGRGWVVQELDEHRATGPIVAFAICNERSGNVWALFVHPAAQGRGHGDRLHRTMLDWLRSRGVARAWLSTGADTRAAGFYQRRGWELVGIIDGQEARYERTP